MRPQACWLQVGAPWSCRRQEWSCPIPLALSPRKKFQKKGASQSFSKAARLKWQSLERRIIDIVMQRMTIVNLEADMERLIKVGPGGPALASPCPPPPLCLSAVTAGFSGSSDLSVAPFLLLPVPALEARGAGGPQGPTSREPRAQLGSSLRPVLHPHPQKREELFLLQENLRRKRERLQAESPEEEKGLQELAEEIEVLAANIDYINDSITDCQATIVQLEETKVPGRARARAEAGGPCGWAGQPSNRVSASCRRSWTPQTRRWSSAPAPWLKPASCWTTFSRRPLTRRVAAPPPPLGRVPVGTDASVGCPHRAARVGLLLACGIYRLEQAASPWASYSR